MKALGYLFVITLKNRLVDIKRSPGKILLYLIVIAVIVLNVISASSPENNPDMLVLKDLEIFEGILFAFFALFLFVNIGKGLSSGGSFFDMSDVNFLFVSPVSPKIILAYGVVRQSGVALLSGFFILFQAPVLRNSFGIGTAGLVIIFASYVLTLVVLEGVSLAIYSYTNGNQKRKTIAKIITALVFVPLLVQVLTLYFAGTAPLELLRQIMSSPTTAFIPVIGWTAQAVTYALMGNWLSAFSFYVASFVLFTSIITALTTGESDYYEDVLCSTETSFEQKSAIKEGNLNNLSQQGRKISVSDTGIKGYGASALLGRHLRESMRANRFKLLDTQSITVVLFTVIATFFAKDILTLTMILYFSLYMLTFFIGTGLGLKELYSHYIYLIPASSFSKIVWSNLEVVVKIFVESILMLGISGAILNRPVLEIALYIAVRTFFSMLLIGINTLFMRIFKVNLSRGLMLTLYFVMVIIAIVPGIIAMALLSTLDIMGMGITLGLLALIAWEIIAAIVCLFFSRSVLDNCDMATVNNG